MTANQRFVLLLAGMTLLGIGWTKVAPPQQPDIPSVIQAREFQVVDKSGTVVIELKVNDQGNAQVLLHSKDEKAGVALVYEPGRGSAFIAASNQEGEVAALMATSNGTELTLSKPPPSEAKPK
jgi:hypothetical protein